MTIRKLYTLGIISYRDEVFVLYNNRRLYDGVYDHIPSQYMDIPIEEYSVMYQSPWGARLTAWLTKGGE